MRQDFVDCESEELEISEYICVREHFKFQMLILNFGFLF